MSDATPVNPVKVSNPVLSVEKPGFKTTEFYVTLLTHLLAAVAVILDALKVSWHHLDAAQAAIPIVALVMAGIAQAVYTHQRSGVKINNVAQAVRLEVAKIEHAVSPVFAELKAFEPAVAAATAADPAVAAVAAKAEEAVRVVEQPAVAVEKIAEQAATDAGVIPSPVVEAAAPVTASVQPATEGDAGSVAPGTGAA